MRHKDPVFGVLGWTEHACHSDQAYMPVLGACSALSTSTQGLSHKKKKNQVNTLNGYKSFPRAFLCAIEIIMFNGKVVAFPIRECTTLPRGSWTMYKCFPWCSCADTRYPQYGRRVPVLHILQFATYLFIQNPLITLSIPLLRFERPLCPRHLDSTSILLWIPVTENSANHLLNHRLNVPNPISRPFIGYSEATFLLKELHIYRLISTSETSSEWGKLLQFSQM